VAESGQFERIRQSFANRFERQGNHWIFRSKVSAAGLAVTDEERDRFLAQYMRRMKIGIWVSTSATVALVVVLFVLGEAFHLEALESTPALVAVILVGLLPIIAGTRWAFREPDRVLRGRPVVEPARTTDEAKRIAFSRLSWPQIGGALLMFAVATLRLTHGDLLHGWNRLWLALLIAMVLLVGVQAFRKWSFERRL
jgi:hypothetical protein